MPEEITFKSLQAKLIKLATELNMAEHAKYLIKEKYGVARLSLVPADKYEALNDDLEFCNHSNKAMNAFDVMNQAVHDAECMMRQADNFAGRMANMLKERLRKVDTTTLAKLKKELQDFNSRTGQWK